MGSETAASAAADSVASERAASAAPPAVAPKFDFQTASIVPLEG
jgi:hypothetical protein